MGNVHCMVSILGYACFGEKVQVAQLFNWFKEVQRRTFSRHTTATTLSQIDAIRLVMEANRVQ